MLERKDNPIQITAKPFDPDLSKISKNAEKEIEKLRETICNSIKIMDEMCLNMANFTDKIIADNSNAINLNENTDICINPFTHVKDIRADMFFIKAIICKMISPVDELDDYKKAIIESKILASYSSHGNETDITLVAEQCLNDKDERVRDIGTSLFPFTRQGSLGQIFHGKNNINLNNCSEILKLLNSRKFKNKKLVQEIILMSVMGAKIDNNIK
jgi:hypothetical protein